MVTYDGPVTLHVNGEDVQLIPIRAAHTDGDTLIRFPKHDVLAVGDYYRSVGYPFVDIFNGGTLDGLLAGLATPSLLPDPTRRSFRATARSSTATRSSRSEISCSQCAIACCRCRKGHDS